MALTFCYFLALVFLGLCLDEFEQISVCPLFKMWDLNKTPFISK